MAKIEIINKPKILSEIRNYGIIDDERKQTVELNFAELQIAELLGRIKSTFGRTRPTFGGDDWRKHFLSYCGEIAFCKIMNICFSPILDPKHNWEVDNGDAM